MAAPAAPSFPVSQPGGGLFSPPAPLWQPPFSVKWVLTGLLIFVGAVANKLDVRYRAPFATPLGFFLTAAAAAVVFEYSGFAPAAFAILFFLLMVWSTTQSESFVGSAGIAKAPEPFAGSQIDFVDDGRKRWFVESVLKENPLGVQEKDVATYPVQGASAQSGTSSGNT